MMEKIELRESFLRDFLHVVFKRKNQILYFFLATVCTVVIGTFFIKPMYEAKAQILVKIGRENVYVPVSGNSGQSINYYRQDEQINSEIEMLKSRTLAENVIKSLRVSNIYKDLDETDTLLNFQKSLSIERLQKSNVIEISFEHTDSKMAATIVNAIVNAYWDRHLLAHKNPQSYKFFEEQSQTLKSKLEQAEETLQTVKKRHNISDIDEEKRLFLKQIADLRAELNRTLSQENETKSRILQIQRQLNRTPERIPQGEQADYNSNLIANLESRLVELQIKEKELLTKYTLQSRLVKNVKEKIQIVRDKLVEQETKRYGSSMVGVNITYRQLKEELFRNQAELQALAAKKETQSTHFAELQGKLDQLNQMEVELNQLQQTVEVNRKNYRLYLTKFEESRISDAMDNKKIANVSLIQEALPPLKPIGSKVKLKILLSIFLGGFGGLGLAYFAEYMDDSLEKPEDVEKVLQLPVLASIPELEGKSYKLV